MNSVMAGDTGEQHRRSRDSRSTMAFLFAEAKEDAPEGGDMFANPRMARMMRPAMRIMMNGLMKVSALLAVVAVHLRTSHTRSHTPQYTSTRLAHRRHLHTPRTRGAAHTPPR